MGPDFISTPLPNAASVITKCQPKPRLTLLGTILGAYAWINIDKLAGKQLHGGSNTASVIIKCQPNGLHFPFYIFLGIPRIVAYHPTAIMLKVKNHTPRGQPQKTLKSSLLYTTMEKKHFYNIGLRLIIRLK